MTAAVRAMPRRAAFPDPADYPPLPVLLAGCEPLRAARDVAEVATAARKMRGTATDADVVLAAFFKLLSLEPDLPPAYSYLLSRLIELQELGNNE